MTQQTENNTRVAVVTGGSRGIGRAVCLQLAKDGFHVAVNYAGNAAAAEETARLCENLGVRAVCLQADVSKPEECAKLFAAVKQEFGRVDVLVNNAGVTHDNLILRMTEADYDAVIDTNLKGAFFCSKEAVRMMLPKRYGRIVNISSVVGVHGNAGQSNYAASKAGLIGLTKSLAKEVAARNITVNAVAPGFVQTEMTAAMPEATHKAALQAIPAGREASPEEIARAVAFLAAQESGYITGQVLGVDGGMGM